MVLKKHTIVRYALLFHLFLFIGSIFTSCGGTSRNNGKGEDDMVREKDTTSGQEKEFSARLEEMTKEEYPDNPNWGATAPEYGSLDHERIVFKRNHDLYFDIQLVPGNEKAFPVVVKNVDLSVYAPKVPGYLKGKDYPEYITLINQEWNRQQIRFSESHYKIKGKGELPSRISRVDIARNCLNAGLWEVILYKREEGVDKPVYHGWFDMPKELYAEMFEKTNDIPYSKYAKPLEKWVEPENKALDPSLLRKVEKEWDVSFKNRNNEFYTLKGARKKKFKNILRPEKPKNIQAMLNDSTTFATFDKPGYYNTGNPRKTQLGKLAKPLSVKMRKTFPKAVNEPRYELDISFLDNNGKDTTRMIIGGLNLDRIPRVSEEHHHQGYKMPMGIAVHSFYETYEEAKKNPVGTNPYFGLLFNGDGKWIDSHKVGIDGPLMHWDAKNADILHFYILSFERHAFVGHFEIKVPESVIEGAGIRA